VEPAVAQPAKRVVGPGESFEAGIAVEVGRLK
jgi:hypothetical protein